MVPAIRRPPGRTSSSPAEQARSTREPARSSATSSASARSGCRRSLGLPSMTAKRPPGALADAHAPGKTGLSRDGSVGTHAEAPADRGWGAPPLAPPRAGRRRDNVGHGQRAQVPGHAPASVSPDIPAPDPADTPPATLADLVTHERLAEFFAPRDIAVVGASPTSA